MRERRKTVFLCGIALCRQQDSQTTVQLYCTHLVIHRAAPDLSGNLEGGGCLLLNKQIESFKP